MVDSGEKPQSASFAEKMKEKLVVVKEKLTSCHSTENTASSPGAAPSQKKSVVGKMKDKVVSGRQDSPSGTDRLGGATSGYETMHGEEEVKAAEEGHIHRIGEKIAHMMPGPPYVQRHEKKIDSAEE